MIHIVDIIFHITFLYSCYMDIVRRIIPEKSFLILLFLSIIRILLTNKLLNMYLAISIFIFPIFIQMLVETYLEKEIIGLGDIKLFVTVGLFFCSTDIMFVLKFYNILYIFSAIYIVILRRIRGYIAFAPMIYLAFCIFNLGVLWKTREKC